MKKETSERFKKKELFNDVTHLFDEYYTMFVSDGNGSEIKASTIINRVDFLFIIFA
jgi:hypothetical protein